MPTRNAVKQKIYSKRHYDKNKELLIQRARVHNASHKKMLREYIIKLKESTPCKDCDTFYPSYVMDFDHVRGKKIREVSVMVKRFYSLAAIIEEIAKCDLVCANCHRKRTWSKKIISSQPV